MEPLARWVRREWNSRTPSWMLFLGMVVLVAGMVALPTGMISGAALMIYLLLLVAAWVPLMVHAGKNRHRPDPRDYVIAASKGRLREAIGPSAGVLNEAAGDLEQLQLLLQRARLEPGLAKRLRREAEARMRRLFEVAVGPPALHGLSKEGSEGQVEADARWLSEARRMLEVGGVPPVAPSEGEALEELRRDAEARDEAIRELLA